MPSCIATASLLYYYLPFKLGRCLDKLLADNSPDAAGTSSAAAAAAEAQKRSKLRYLVLVDKWLNMKVRGTVESFANAVLPRGSNVHTEVVFANRAMSSMLSQQMRGDFDIFPEGKFGALCRRCLVIAQQTVVTPEEMDRRLSSGLAQPPPHPARVCIAMLHSHHISEYGEIAAAANEAYAKRHGYAFRIVRKSLDESRHPAWSKFLHLRRLLQRYEWVLWVDSDAIVVNPTFNLSRTIQGCSADAGKSLWVCTDSMNFQGLFNTGTVLLRAAGGHADRILRAMYDTVSVPTCEKLIARHPWDQGGTYVWMYLAPEDDLRVGILSPDVCNTHPAEMFFKDKRWSSEGAPHVMHASNTPAIFRQMTFRAVAADACRSTFDRDRLRDHIYNAWENGQTEMLKAAGVKVAA